MQGVYAKYRSMKKEIRHLAAVEIQRLWRGFLSRLRSGQDRVSTFVSSTNAMSMSGSGGSAPVRSSSSGGNDMVLKDLEEDSSSAMDIGGGRDSFGSAMDVTPSVPAGMDGSVLPPQPSMNEMDTRAGSAPDVLSLSATVDANAIYQHGRAGRDRGAAGAGGAGPVPGAMGNSGARPLTPAVSATGTSAALLSSTAVNSTVIAASAASGASDSASVMYARYKELLTEKRELKRLLKKFDEEFAAKHGRLPQKPEKEVMRPKYQKYHEIKHDMELLRTTIEQKHGPMPSDDEQDGRDGSRERSLSLSESVDKLFADVGDETVKGGSGSGSGRRGKDRANAAPPVTNSASINALLVAPPTRSSVVATGTAGLR